MKRTLFFAVSLMTAVSVFGQGQVNFNNRVTTGTAGTPQEPIVASIYGPDPLNPTLKKTGQPDAAHGGNPAGVQTYGGPLLQGTGFTVQLWGGPGGSTEGHLLLATLAAAGNPAASTTFRTGTAAGGLLTAGLPSAVANIPNAPAGSGSRATMQLRAWDNKGGTITTWAQAVGDVTVASGASPLFTPPFDLGGGPVTPPNLIGLVSFNIAPVPEPSAIALGVLGLGTVMFLRRRKA